MLKSCKTAFSEMQNEFVLVVFECHSEAKARKRSSMYSVSYAQQKVNINLEYGDLEYEIKYLDFMAYRF